MSNLKKLLILSGKGGTGKTTVACAFIKLYGALAYADCDVDAPNLHLVCEHEKEPLKQQFFGLQKAVIDNDKCVGCGLCIKHCRFSAISEIDGVYSVDKYACEGCAVCEFVCPAEAVVMENSAAGELMLYKGDTAFSTACLYMGSGNSGKLVAAVKKQLYDNLVGAPVVAVIDGSPGIGCPVIASLSGVDMVLIVAEPSISGITDMGRIIQTARGFENKIVVCVNKYDTNIENTAKIEKYCEENKIPFVGKIPYDKEAVSATNKGISIVEIECLSGKAVKFIFNETMALLLN